MTSRKQDEKLRPSDQQGVGQLSSLPEGKGASKDTPPSQRAEHKPATRYDGSPQPDPRQDKPGLSAPQDDTPWKLEKREGPK
ncbi:MAG: hypothetical protein QHC78_17685 [Pigmentiphaga sp.]|uniref:hypothetical protein n=1 Tax=Pigmentiphaga sp. TaxID=1977564 RepID=UPI00299FE3D4|nr:hypothetical protein [Pigmentiphaga sp.]MDX3907525.1 hypothetical protein [Pigmentiphaga sp.]